MAMTMVDFNKLQLKRSVNPVTYAFMFHSLISVHMADHEDSYDHYDAILCAGPHQMREVRKREEMLGMPEASARVMILALHKARYECNSLPEAERRLSGQWLAENGFRRMDGGEVLPRDTLPS